MVNIQFADTRNVGGKAFGQMVLQLPDDHLQQDKAIFFLKEKGLKVEEVKNHAH
jgi:D-methionine transport system ATP-binding protein